MQPTPPIDHRSPKSAYPRQGRRALGGRIGDPAERQQDKAAVSLGILDLPSGRGLGGLGARDMQRRRRVRVETPSRDRASASALSSNSLTSARISEAADACCAARHPPELVPANERRRGEHEREWAARREQDEATPGRSTPPAHPAPRRTTATRRATRGRETAEGAVPASASARASAECPSSCAAPLDRQAPSLGSVSRRRCLRASEAREKRCRGRRRDPSITKGASILRPQRASLRSHRAEPAAA